VVASVGQAIGQYGGLITKRHKYEDVVAGPPAA
jgi:hypothetical protein